MDLISKGLSHLRIMDLKDLDNKQNGEWLEGVRGSKEEQALQSKPKNGSELGYTKGQDSEVDQAKGKTVKAPDQEKPDGPGTSEKTEGGPGSGGPNDD